jgi:hypothetical protein
VQRLRQREQLEIEVEASRVWCPKKKADELGTSKLRSFSCPQNIGTKQKLKMKKKLLPIWFYTHNRPDLASQKGRNIGILKHYI